MNIILTLTSIFIFAFSLLPSQVNAAANTYYVTQNGNGARSGVSLGNAWSVSDFNSSDNWSTTDNPTRIDPGDTVYFSGTITSTLRPEGSGSSGNYITLDGYEAGDCDPINSECTDSGEITNTDYAFYFTTQDYFILQDFRSDGGSWRFYGTSTSSDSSHIIIRRNEIHDVEGSGVKFNYGDYITIGGASGQGNEIYDIGVDTSDADISPEHTEDIIVSYNHLYATKSNGNSGDRGIDGIVTHYVKRMLVEYNSIHSHNDNYGSDARGEDGMDFKKETHDLIVRFNNVYDHKQQVAIMFQGGCYNVYAYGNRLWDNAWGGISVYGRNKNFHALDEIHIWSNLIAGNKKNGIVVSTQGDTVDDIYIYNNTIARTGIEYTDLYGKTHTVDSTYVGLLVLTGDVRIKNNIFYKGQPEKSTYYQSRYNSTSNVNTLGYNTYYWPSKTSQIYYSGGWRSVANLKSSYSLRNDFIAEQDDNPGFIDPDGADNTYETVDDHYTLDGTNVDDGEDLSDCFDVSIQGRNYHMCYNDALDPNATNWTRTPPTVRTTKQENYGSWDRGAYVYTGDMPSSPTTPSSPSLLRILTIK